MGKKSAPPPAPDYASLAEQTAASNKAAIDAQTKANRPNQTDVYGNTSTWSQSPTGEWTQSQQLSQQNQDWLDAQNKMRGGLMGQAQDALSKPADLSQLQGYSNYDPSKLQNVDPSALGNGTGPYGMLGNAGQMGQLQGNYGPYGQLQENYGNRGQLQENYGQMGNLQGAGMFNMDPTGNSKAIQDATYGLLAPQRTMERNSEIQRLKNQGLTEDSPAFQRAVQRLDTGDTQAQLQALLAGTTEYGNQFQRAAGQNQQNFGQNLNAAQLANAQQAQLFGQDMSRAGLANENQAALFGQDVSRAGLANQTEQQRYAQDIGQAQFGSQNQQQLFNQNLQGANYADQQNQQKWAQNLQQQQLAQQLRGQQFDEQSKQAQLDMAMRGQQLTEQDYLRQQPLNNLQQILQMQSLSNPQFGSFMGAGTAGGTDYSGAGQQQYNAAMGANNAKNAASASTTQGIIGVASIAAMAF